MRVYNSTLLKISNSPDNHIVRAQGKLTQNTPQWHVDYLQPKSPEEQQKHEERSGSPIFPQKQEIHLCNRCSPSS